MGALPGCDLVDIGADTARQRMIKSQEEIEVIKVGAATADIGGEACRAAVVAGAREWEVAREGVTAMVRHISNTMEETADSPTPRAESQNSGSSSVSSTRTDSVKMSDDGYMADGELSQCIMDEANILSESAQPSDSSLTSEASQVQTKKGE